MEREEHFTLRRWNLGVEVINGCNYDTRGFCEASWGINPLERKKGVYIVYRRDINGERLLDVGDKEEALEIARRLGQEYCKKRLEDFRSLGMKARFIDETNLAQNDSIS